MYRVSATPFGGGPCVHFDAKDNLGALLLHPACNMTSSHAWPPNHMLPLHHGCDHHHDAHVILNVSFVPDQNHLTYVNVCLLQKP